MNLKKITIALSIAFIVTLMATIYFIYNTQLPNDSAGNIKIEVIKYLMELIVVVILGSIVAVLFKAEEVNRAKEELERIKREELNKKQIEIRNDFMKRLGNFYHKTKFTRRTM